MPIIQTLEGNVNITRRSFLTQWGRLIGLVVGWRVFRPVFAEAEKEPEWYKVGKLDDFEPGKAVLVKKGRHIEKDVPVHLSGMYVIRGPEGVTVFSAACTHEKCEVNPDRDGGFTCPCHSAKFGANGQVLKGPAKAPLAQLPAKVENGEVLVRTTK